MERRRSEELIKKGPWTPEEDQVLINFVNRYGPRDWSSIRSMGLLPRTGKSCRLRWVNKLRPNLKIGCKFSAEEERVVIELQGRLGNKWATIASYLPGRTDNDVKNFWSTRQKRLARILQSPPRQIIKPPKNRGKLLPVPEITTFQVPKYSSMKMEEESSSNCQSCSSSCMGDPADMVQMIIPLPPADLITPNMPNDLGPNLPLLEITETDDVRTKPSTTESEIPLKLPFTQHIPNSSPEVLDLPLALPENHDSALLGETHFLDVSELENLPHLNFGSPFLELEGTTRGKDHGRAQDREKLATPDSFFDELPDDMFDCFDPFPGSSSPI